MAESKELLDKMETEMRLREGVADLTSKLLRSGIPPAEGARHAAMLAKAYSLLALLDDDSGPLDDLVDLIRKCEEP